MKSSTDRIKELRGVRDYAREIGAHGVGLDVADAMLTEIDALIAEGDRLAAALSDVLAAIGPPLSPGGPTPHSHCSCVRQIKTIVSANLET